MVCGGELDLSTAQRDIATDWIAAYKKYFHTNRPLTLHSRLESVNVLGLAELPRNRVKPSNAAEGHPLYRDHT